MNNGQFQADVLKELRAIRETLTALLQRKLDDDATGSAFLQALCSKQPSQFSNEK